MATITICDICKTGADPRKFNEWVEIRWCCGDLAKFFEEPNKKMVMCSQCYRDLIEKIAYGRKEN